MSYLPPHAMNAPHADSAAAGDFLQGCLPGPARSRAHGLPYLLVGVANDVLSVPFLQVREVVAAASLAVERIPSPGSAGSLLRSGRIVPLFDLRVLLGVPEPMPEDRRGVVISTGPGCWHDAPVGVLVDSVGPVVTLASTEISPIEALGDCQADFLLAIGRVNGARRSLLEVGRLLPLVRPPGGSRRS